LHQRRIELTFIEKLKDLAKAKSDHLVKVTKHLLRATDFVEILEHRDHHLEVVRLFILQSHLSANVVISILMTEYKERHHLD
jgi:hypothetical protein